MTEEKQFNNMVLEGGTGSFFFNAQLWPVNITFSNIGTLKPIADITPLEAVRLCMMLVCAQSGSNIDYPAFIKENALERHFTK